MKIASLISGFFVLTMTTSAHGAPKLDPKGVAGYAGAGYATYKVSTPSTRFKIDQGEFATLGGEKGLGFFNSYLTFGLNYLKSAGLTDYDYTTLGGQQYGPIQDMNFSMDEFQIGLGFKIKLIDGFFFRPYVEGGGTFGYYTLEFKPLKAQTDALKAIGSNYKLKDSLLDFGSYAEVGLEVNFSSAFGLKLAGRLLNGSTKEFDTLNKQKITYASEIYYVTLLKAF